MITCRFVPTQALLELARRDSARVEAVWDELREVCMPLVGEEWELQPRYHPDKEFVGYCFETFQVGFHYGQRRVRTSRGEHEVYQKVIDKYLAKEVQLGRMVGPVFA